MRGNDDAVSVLAPLLRATADTCPLLFLGAGASFHSGVPLAAEAVKQIARLVFAQQELRGARTPERGSLGFTDLTGSYTTMIASRKIFLSSSNTF
jgi:hypothetical protein